MRAVRPLLAATAFLTRVPAGRVAVFDGIDVSRAAPVYPLVGAAIGAAAGGVADVLAGPLPAIAAAAAGLGLAALLTGGMHLDALADTADALGGPTRGRRLEIMRDPAVGPFGAVALVLTLLFEAAVLAELAERGDALAAFAAAGACSRWAPLPLAAVLSSARAEGQASALVQGTSPAAAAAGLAIAAAVTALALRGDAIAALAAVAVVATTLGLFFRGWIGGVTGDTLGATTELAQAAALAAALAAG
jgi:adenosylcobinamide-GDP ribazoletransferase